MRTLPLLVVLALISVIEPARADKPAPPLSKKITSANGKFVFVLISPSAKVDEIFKNEAIRAYYAKSGLYKNDGSKEPLWTVDWFRYKVDVAEDGEHVIRHGDWPNRPNGMKNSIITKEDLKQEGVSFFAKGKLLREYSIGELVDDTSKLSTSVTHFMWRAESRLIDETKTLELRTYDGNRFRFDITTAKILEKKRQN